MNYQSVQFNEGAPLDPAQLNQLQANISKVLQATSQELTSAMDKQSSITTYSTHGSVSVDVKAGKVATADIKPNASFAQLGSEKNPIRYFATMRSTPTDNMQVTVSVQTEKEGQNAKIYVSSNQTKKLWFSWYAVVNKS